MNKKILIIEDEPAIQKILSEPLVFAGYKVATASDSLEGINAFRRESFDLILLDILLPQNRRVRSVTHSNELAKEADIVFCLKKGELQIFDILDTAHRKERQNKK